MNVDAFRHFYNYHFALNRYIWDNHIVTLSQEQFTQPLDYSQGSVRNQIVHLISVDDAWFSDLQGMESLDPPESADRDEIRVYGDQVEQRMRAYLDTLTEAVLLAQPLHGEDYSLFVWQVLLQVVNHGTDHRAQLLRQLYDLGQKTTAQDYIFYAYDRPVGS